MAVAWPLAVNTDAYGMDTAPVENVERIQFESGKDRVYLKNSRGRKQHTFLLAMNDVGAASEYKQFIEWYENTLKSGSLSFTFQNLVTHSGTKEYRLLDYSATGQRVKEVSITVEEM